MGKIFILANSDVGLYKFRRELIAELIACGHTVSLSLPAGRFANELAAMGCRCFDSRVDRRGTNPFADFKLFVWYLRVIGQQKPDLVITYTIKPNLYGGMACRLSRIPYALHITGLGSGLENKRWFSPLVRGMYRAASRRAAVLFVENQDNQTFLENGKYIPHNTACLLNGAGVNLSDYPPACYPREASPVRFLFAGRIMKEKGVEELFRAASLLHQADCPIAVELVGPFEEDYSGAVAKLEQRGILRYHGEQETIRPFLEQCHCLVLPSHHEGMANVLLEAGATGRPLITTRIPGCLEAVVEGKSGFLCRPGSYLDLYRQMLRFAQLSHCEKRRMGELSRKHIQAHFDRIEVVRRIMQALPPL